MTANARGEMMVGEEKRDHRKPPYYDPRLRRELSISSGLE